MKTYITYGKGNKFRKELLPAKEEIDFTYKSILNKPQNCMWGSPVNANYGWKQWCECNEFNCNTLKESFKWTLKAESRVLLIKEFEDLSKVPFVKHPFISEPAYFDLLIDFEELSQNYDALELCMDNYYFGHLFRCPEEMAFNGWDCDSIVVFNRETIVEIVR